MIIEKRRVVIESPYKGDIKLNEGYARLAMLDSVMRGEAPFASHLLYTQILDDTIEEERNLGIELGFAWLQSANLVAFYIDLGMSPGMRLSQELLTSTLQHKPFEMRRINRDDLTKLLNAKS